MSLSTDCTYGAPMMSSPAMAPVASQGVQITEPVQEVKTTPTLLPAYQGTQVDVSI